MLELNRNNRCIVASGFRCRKHRLLAAIGACVYNRLVCTETDPVGRPCIGILMTRARGEYVIIVTGGAGFIGSNIVKALNERGHDKILIVDSLGKSEKWKNLRDLRIHDYEGKVDFLEKVEKGFFKGDVTAVLHMGACSSTTERDADYLTANNFCYSRALAEHFGRLEGVRFIYASSAATYGDGTHGYSDDHAQIPALRPLNMYGYSKQLFDMWALDTGFAERAVGLKYFNVFGPNEYHKGDMRSVVIRSYFQIRQTGAVKLFKSYRPDYGDGEQARDFIYVKDAVNITLSFLEQPAVNGIFNAGTGAPRTFNDLAAAVAAALDKPRTIQYIDMPPGLEKKYQYYTCADTDKLMSAGYSSGFQSLEDAVHDYVVNYLLQDERGETDIG